MCFFGGTADGSAIGGAPRVEGIAVGWSKARRAGVQVGVSLA